MHRATQLPVLIFPLCSLDMHAHCSVMGFRAGKTIDGEMAFAERGVVCLHSPSTQETASWGKQWLAIAGNGAGRKPRGSFPLGFMVIIALPSPKEEAANESTGVVRRQSVYLHSRGGAVAVCWEQRTQLGQRWAPGRAPELPPLFAAPSVLVRRGFLLSFLCRKQTINSDLRLMQCSELGAGEV